MTGSIIYEGNGKYGANLDSGYVSIHKDEIYELIQEIAKQDTIPTFVETFEFSSLWTEAVPMIPSTTLAVSVAKTTDDAEFLMEDLVEEIIIVSQELARDYYTTNYIMVEKY